MPRLPRFERNCVVLVGAGAIALPVAAILLPASAAAVHRFAVASLVVWAFLARQLWDLRGIDGAGAAGQAPNLTGATAVTLLRGWLIALVAGHLGLPPLQGRGLVSVGLLYTCAALLDGVDGRIARRRRQVTQLGARLDVVTDATGLVVAPLVAVRAGQLPPWYLALSLAYPLFRTALAVRRWRGRPLFPERLRANPRARLFAGVQMAMVATSLYPVLPQALLWGAATVVMLPTLVLFAREWRTVTGAAGAPS
jgi:CDP-diacylglycerol--glycerol-3-phosphate 3-phosphatidyltransferase